MKITDFIDENNIFYYAQPIEQYELTDTFKRSKNITHFYVKYNIDTTKLEYEVPEYKKSLPLIVFDSVKSSSFHADFEDMYEEFLHRDVFKFLPFYLKDVANMICRNKYVNIFHCIPSQSETRDDQIIALLNEGNTPEKWIKYVEREHPHLLPKSIIFDLLLLEDPSMIRYKTIEIIHDFCCKSKESISEEDIQKVFSIHYSKKGEADPSDFISQMADKIHYILDEPRLKNVLIETLKANPILLKNILRRSPFVLEERLFVEVCGHAILK